MAIQIPNGRQQFTDSNGVPLAGGSVAFYTPGTTTPKATYQDAASTVQNTNPILLDSKGSAVIWGDGTYRQVVFDANNNQIWDEVTSASTAGGSSGFPSGISVAGSGVVVSAGGAAITGDVAINGALAVNNHDVEIANTAGANLILSGSDSTNRAIYLRTITGTPDRWILGAGATPESGGNVGSDFFINRYSDAGDYIDTPLSVTRQDGIVRLTNLLAVGSALLQADGNIFMPWFAGGDYLSNIINQRVRTTDAPSFAGITVGGFPVLRTSDTGAGAGWILVPGGLIVQWGINNAGGGSGVQNYPIAFPHGVGYVGLTPFNPGSVLNVSSSNAGGFAWGALGATGFNFLAVGN